MKHLKIQLTLVISVCFLYLMGSCKDDDISTSNEKIGRQEITLEETNANIKAIQQLIKAKINNLGIKSCTPSNDRASYQIELTNGTVFTLYTQITAIDDNNERTSYIPLIGIQERDETYYWTIDNEWLLTNGATGSKIEATSKAAFPKIEINEQGFWTINHDNIVYVPGEKVESGKVKSYFSNIDLSNAGYITFTFSNDTPALTLPIRGDSGQNPITGSLRRSISPTQPMWIIHIDTWTYPDPEKVIDLIPNDILPYIVFNIALSTSPHDDEKMGRLEYGYETAKSWLRSCAAKGVWAMVQPASGGKCHFPDIKSYAEMEASLFNEFYRDYPNFIGFNYSEQFWGFDDPIFNGKWKYEDRLTHFTHLMKLNNKYGGYLVINFCNALWGSGYNPIAMYKKSASFAEACSLYPENFILCEKYTSKNGFFDVESTCLGTYLSGYSGQYGIRFDESGWNGLYGDTNFPVAAGAIPTIEHIMLTGQTVIDGPELIWQQCYKEGTTTTVGGFKQKNWEMHPQFENISIDIFRKIVDGTIQIPSRQEVIDRTKVVIIQDVTSGSNAQKYSVPNKLYEGLYRMDDDGNNQSSDDYNLNYFKKTGRYPTIPVVYQLRDATAQQGFTTKVNQSAYTSQWGDITKKRNEFNALFPEEYTGTLYAGRSENGWVTYNPTGEKASATIPFKYNTCDRMELTYAKYTTGVVREYNNKLTFYLTNYSNVNNSLKNNVIKIYGCSSRPTISYIDRGIRTTAPKLSESWSNNVYTLTIDQNGPLDVTVNCSGNATGRSTSYRTATISAPNAPQLYEGAQQYEAENFDYKNITENVKTAIGKDIRNYTAMGYVNFGKSASAAVKETVHVSKDGIYQLQIKYRAPGATINTVDLYINDTRTNGTPQFVRTTADWEVNVQQVTLKKGDNTIELRAKANGAGDFFLDNIVIKGV